MTLIENILLPPESEANLKLPKNLKSLLTGRMFSTFTNIVDFLNPNQKVNSLYMNRVIEFALKSISPE